LNADKGRGLSEDTVSRDHSWKSLPARQHANKATITLRRSCGYYFTIVWLYEKNNSIIRTAERDFLAESVAYTATGIYDGSSKKIGLPKTGLIKAMAPKKSPRN
jgi:hypothetical protein